MMKEELVEKDGTSNKMQLYFCANLEPTQMRWKSDQVRTQLSDKERNVQECNSVKSTCNPTLPSAWASLRHSLLPETKRNARYDPRCIHPASARRIAWNMATLENTTLAYKHLRMSAEHFMMLGCPQLLKRAEGL